MNMRAKKQRGFSLVELAIVLGVMGLVSGGIWVAVSAVSYHHRVNKTIEQVQQIVQNVRDHYNAAAAVPVQSYNFLTQTEARADVFPAETKLMPNVLPATCGGGGGAIACYFVNPWSNDGTGAICGGGTICLGANNAAIFSGAALGNNFVLKFRNLPGAACVDVTMKLTGLWDEIGLAAFGISTTNAVAAGTIFNAPPAPPALAAVTAACDPAQPNHLFMEFRLRAP